MSIYLQVSEFEGGVTAEGLEKAIELHSFAFNVKRKMYTQPGAIYDREGSRPAISEITITKRVDRTTPLFFGEATVGLAKPKMIIKFVNTGSVLSEYLTITLYNVLVSGYSITDQGTLLHASPENVLASAVEKPIETITLNFDKIEIKYTPYDEKHKAGSPIPAGYDLKGAKAI
jgi:type VI secretion system secreted protein Hcp